MREWMQDYLDAVGAQIRWKPAQPVVLRELGDHLQDQCDACLEDGLPQIEARKEALRQMGDPVTVGQELDAVHRPKSSREIVGAVLGLLAVNLLLWLTVFFDGDLRRWLWMPLGCMAAGLAVMALCSLIPWNGLLKHVWKLGIAGGFVFFWLGEVFFPGGSSRWTVYYVLLLPLVHAGILYALRNSVGWSLLVNGVCTAVMLWTADRYSLGFLGMVSLLVTGLVMTLLTLSREPKIRRRWYRAAAIGLFLGIAVVFLREFVNQLIMEQRYLGGFYGELYREVLRHVRWFGPGEAFTMELYGESRSVMPGQNLIVNLEECDYFLTKIMYECGILAGILMAAAVALLLGWCLYRGLKQPTLWGKLIACAIVIPMLLQTKDISPDPDIEPNTMVAPFYGKEKIWLIE